ncbi:MAG: protoporphyrinogen oxidase [Terriglobales bacterium]
MVIVGAGIAGLAAAWELSRRGVGNVQLFEATARAGGAICTERREGFCLEAGPDSFLAAKPAAAELCRAVGLGGELTGCAPARPRTWMLHRARLEPLPEGWQFLAPARWWPALRTRLLSGPAKLRLAQEFLAPARLPPGDVSVSAWVRARFGPEVLDRLVAPLLAGVYGGNPEQLSFAATLPRFAALAAGGSVGRALWRQRRQSPPGAAPLFLTLRAGMDALPQALAAAIGAERLHLAQPVAAVRRGRVGDYQVRLADGAELSASAVVIAAPAWAAADMLAPLDGAMAAALAQIPYASAAAVHLAYAQAPPLPPGFGLLAPRQEGRRLLAATFVHQKFPHRVPPGAALLRLFYGGALDAEVLQLPDAGLAMLAREEAAAILGIAAEADWRRFHRWPRAMPQYTLGHAERVARLEARRARHPRLALAGAAYYGVGLPDAIASGQAAARAVLDAG